VGGGGCKTAAIKPAARYVSTLISRRAIAAAAAAADDDDDDDDGEGAKPNDD